MISKKLSIFSAFNTFASPDNPTKIKGRLSITIVLNDIALLLHTFTIFSHQFLYPITITQCKHIIHYTIQTVSEQKLIR